MIKKKILVLIMAVALFLSSCLTVFAGNINANESWIIGQASGTFPYKGVVYVASEESMGMLYEYLMRDDIDITAEQAQEAVALMYDNVAAGVEGGYIIPITGPEVKPEPEPEDNIVIEKDPAESTVTIDKNGETVFEGSTAVKNTGFSLNLTATIAVIFAICLAASAVLFMKVRDNDDQI